MARDYFSLENGGQMITQWPDRISTKDAEDILDYLKLLARKIPRFVDVDGPRASNASNSEAER